MSGTLPKRLRGSNQKVCGAAPGLVASRAMLTSSHRITDSTLPHADLLFSQRGKPHQPHDNVVSQPQGRGTGEGGEERRNKRRPTLSWRRRGLQTLTPLERVPTSGMVSPRETTRERQNRWRRLTRLVIEPTNGPEITHWSQINWTKVEANVRRRQGRIYRAAANGEQAKVKNLQRLLVRSTSAKLQAIRQVSQRNDGKDTPGVDGVVCATPEARLELLKDGRHLGGYRPQPVRRVSIPKGNGKMRPLGIPTIKDRAMQAVVKLALEPAWASRFEANSYGFRPGRSTMDAITAMHTTLNRKDSSPWILDADITGCFDNIDHEVILTSVPMFTTTMRRWLKAGVVELGRYTDTEAGTPQGGPLSPLLANIALDGFERLFAAETSDGKPVKPSSRRGLNHKVSLIRYADDEVVTAPTREVLEQYVIPKVNGFLAERG